MNYTYKLFLSILKDAVRNRPYTSDDVLEQKEWGSVFRLAMIHDVIPLFINAVYTCDALSLYASLRDSIAKQAKKIAVNQASRTADFILLYEQMQSAGLSPIVMKGILCRNLYEAPELRPSVDEDLLIRSDEIVQYHEFLIHHGFHLVVEDIELEKSYEISYKNDENNLYLEVHRSMFPNKESAYSNLNALFEPMQKPITETIYDTEIRTLEYTDHLLYMICHAYKHMLYGGIGIRQICDMGLFAEKYSERIDWERLITGCKENNLYIFASAIFNTCRDYLGIDISACSFDDNVDPDPLLEDILSGGTYGTANENRAHSATMTLRAVSAERNGVHNNGLMRSLFPHISYMRQKYPYLKQHEWLLPAAWGQRIFDYAVHRNKNTNPVKSIEIGKKRIELLKTYGLLK